MIEVSGLSKEYGLVRALKSVTFTIGENEVVGLLGPNGAGKTTLMKILTGYLHPTEGSATIDDMDVVDHTLAVQKKIGYLPENAPVYPEMVVQEYLQLIAALREVPEDRQLPLLREAVKRTGLEKHLVRPIGELSKGYRQRVGLAQAILHQPEILILDEPTSGLDPSQIVEIRQLIKELATNATVLLSTHILSEVELTCERVLIISEGEVQTDAQLEELRGSSHAAIVATDGDAGEVQKAFGEIEGVTAVTKTSTDNGFATYRVVGGGKEICPMLFDVARDQGWRLAELRTDRQTLERIFRDVTEGPSSTARTA